jgi:hypothetical protein
MSGAQKLGIFHIISNLTMLHQIHNLYRVGRFIFYSILDSSVSLVTDAEYESANIKAVLGVFTSHPHNILPNDLP